MIKAILVYLNKANDTHFRKRCHKLNSGAD